MLKAFKKEKTFTVRLLFSFEQIGRYECFEEEDKSRQEQPQQKKVECFKYFYTYFLFIRKADNRLGSKITSTWSKSDSLSSAVDFKILQLLISTKKAPNLNGQNMTHKSADRKNIPWQKKYSLVKKYLNPQ